ncbi:hypothetical protein [Endozoicomonas sp. ONNA1]|uniref:hypothetical protein n=1 Tax=Endozoicomonas sp. ONNA1 TaxID=2828740 RepID=UPI0021488151|nr:hypothetical protein [Endozoicomonas sp. ONNA1]
MVDPKKVSNEVTEKTEKYPNDVPVKIGVVNGKLAMIPIKDPWASFNKNSQ